MSGLAVNNIEKNLCTASSRSWSQNRMLSPPEHRIA